MPPHGPRLDRGWTSSRPHHQQAPNFPPEPRVDRRSPSRRWLVGGIVVTAVILAALGGLLAAGHEEKTPTTGPATVPVAPARSPAPIRFAGRGQTTTAPFPVVTGLIVVTAIHGGDKTFTVELLSNQGRMQRLAMTAPGQYEGSVGFGLPTGVYKLRIQANGPWNVVINQPRNAPAVALPKSYAGGSGKLVGPFRVSGGVRLTASYRGSGNFVVELLNEQGQSQLFLLDEIGRFEGSRVVPDLPDGAYYLNVDADAPWAVSLSDT